MKIVEHLDKISSLGFEIILDWNTEFGIYYNPDSMSKLEYVSHGDVTKQVARELNLTDILDVLISMKIKKPQSNLRFFYILVFLFSHFANSLIAIISSLPHDSSSDSSELR